MAIALSRLTQTCGRTRRGIIDAPNRVLSPAAKSTTNASEATTISTHDSTHVTMSLRYGEPYCGPNTRRMPSWCTTSRPAMSVVRSRFTRAVMEIAIVLTRIGSESLFVDAGRVGAI